MKIADIYAMPTRKSLPWFDYEAQAATGHLFDLSMYNEIDPEAAKAEGAALIKLEVKAEHYLDYKYNGYLYVATYCGNPFAIVQSWQQENTSYNAMVTNKGLFDEAFAHLMRFRCKPAPTMAEASADLPNLNRFGGYVLGENGKLEYDPLPSHKYIMFGLSNGHLATELLQRIGDLNKVSMTDSETVQERYVTAIQACLATWCRDLGEENTHVVNCVNDDGWNGVAVRCRDGIFVIGVAPDRMDGPISNSAIGLGMVDPNPDRWEELKAVNFNVEPSEPNNKLGR
jgi:hypothetical protein